MNALRLAEDLRLISVAEIWADGDRETAKAVEFAQKRLMEAASYLFAIEQRKGRPAHVYTPEERRAYGELMRAKRERAEIAERPAKKVKKSHLYRTILSTH